MTMETGNTFVAIDRKMRRRGWRGWEMVWQVRARAGTGTGPAPQNNAPTPAHPGSLDLTSLPCTSLHSPHGLMLGADVRSKPGFIVSDDFSGCLRGLLVRNRMAMPLNCARVRHDTYGRPATREQARDDNPDSSHYWSIGLGSSLLQPC